MKNNARFLIDKWNREITFFLDDNRLVLTYQDLKGLIRPETFQLDPIKFYQNGDWSTLIFQDGTKVRAVVDPTVKDPKTEFPDSADICITSYCDNACPICYNNSGLNGKHCDIEDFKKIIDTYKGGEVAIGGGNPFYHPQLTEMLTYCRDKGVLPSITVNLNHLEIFQRTIEEMLKSKLIYGVGISYVHSELTDERIEIIKRLNKINHQIVIHIVNGVFDEKKIDRLKDLSKKTRVKILILGYKDLGRGRGKNVNDLKDLMKRKLLDELVEFSSVISADTLALEQLELSKRVPKFLRRYQGEEGSCSMYIDLVSKTFSRSSIETENIYPLNDNYNVKELFDIVRV